MKLKIQIDNIKPKIDLVLGINNRMGFVSTQALFDYLDRLKKKIIEDEKKWG